MIEPDESGFDAGLRALAGRLMDELPPDLPSRDREQEGLFRAMQTFATIKEMTGSVDDLARCEAMGRMNVRTLGGHTAGAL